MKSAEPEDSIYSCFFPSSLYFKAISAIWISLMAQKTTLQNYKFKMLLETPPQDSLSHLKKASLKPTSLKYDYLVHCNIIRDLAGKCA